MALKRGKKQAQPQVMMEINTTPLIDVMLVLLIMLIITIPAQLHSVDLNLPTARQNPPPQEEEPQVVRISIEADNIIRWDDETVTPDALEQKLRLAAAQARQPELHIRADRAAIYRQVVAVMAAVQRHRLTRIGLVGLERFEH
ncbi:MULTISPECIES: ExbD/TolR family protein [Brenneria]|uniref:Biopolymer transporter ExbD n=1 Tax=Brenneria nigrifluens DSM 30175 = ATCC 13028 TaxID=1121120 RepID=A0A2U1URD9_9GAMM|nr:MULTISPECIES: biopolymer transporter ExbD [Brenneria]EHD23148.1 Biopolymer transport protein ExbD/TolR [Brenneria sp. EniD312]PWC24239.1 biopolymer transporter ExbD [Brenneria nigrifluens DSM 30175 = ATCC 13028]QCR06030.1 biopolymer transporter ExbD [Brenneria nigrifluens DSM 30175 = ATCC 13028]